MSIKLVTQAENAIELNCKFNGNIDLKAPIKQQAGGAVRYDTPQTLTDDQKSQARTNIGAISEAELVQPDWEQNDETAKDYIKNRICYEEETVTELGNTYAVWNELTKEEQLAPLSYKMNGVIYKDVVPVYTTASHAYQYNGVAPYDHYIAVLPANKTIDSAADFQFVKVENTVKQIDKKFIPDEALTQANWNENDESSPAYIQNRICYDNSVPISATISSTLSRTENLTNDEIQMFHSWCQGTSPVTLKANNQAYVLQPGGFSNGYYYLNYNGANAIYHYNGSTRSYLQLQDAFLADKTAGMSFTLYVGDIKQIDLKFIPIDDALDANSENPVQNKTIAIALNQQVEFIDSNYVSPTLDQSEMFTDDQKQVARDNIGALGEADIDSALSSTSENAVQNKVVKAAIEEVQSATKQYIDEKVGSASGSGSTIKSIALTTNNISADTAADYKEALAYLWGNGSTRYVNLSECIITIDGVMVSYVYVNSPYIYFYVPVSANFEFDASRRLEKYCYFCNYTEAIAATSTYTYIKKVNYATNILTSDNYTQYISDNGTYTQDISDSNLYNAKEVYVHIQTSDSRCTSVTIQVPENYILGEKLNEYYYFPESETSNGYLWYDGSTFYVSGSNTIDYIWYK